MFSLSPIHTRLDLNRKGRDWLFNAEADVVVVLYSRLLMYKKSTETTKKNNADLYTHTHTHTKPGG